MLIAFKYIRKLLLTVYEKTVSKAFVMEQIISPVKANIRTLRSNLSVKVETEEKEIKPTVCTGTKYSKAKNKKQPPRPSVSPINTKHEMAKKTISIKQVNVEEVVKVEICSDDDYKTVIQSTPDMELGLPKPPSKTVSPRKRRQVKTKSDNVKKEKIVEVVKTEIPCQDMEDAWEPENWREVLDNILKMRKLFIAPVDSLGCEECPDKNAQPEVFRYQTLISVMLSSQTRDEVTYAATRRLIDHGLNVDSILDTPDERIGELIYPAGFWKSKVKYIKNTTRILKDNYDGDIPRTFKDLCKLPGIGPKMANLVMSVAWGDTVGIAVDTHVHRISNRLGWLKTSTKGPEQTRKNLESWLPKNFWKDVSLALVGFGQTICKPIKPRCQDCLNKNVCPSAKV